MIAATLKEWFNRLFDRRRRSIGTIMTVSSAATIPEEVVAGEAVLVGPPYKWLIVGCPCRCGEKLWLNLMAHASPRWNMSLRSGKLTVSPSVDAVECGSHFWITDGVIRWV